MNQRVELNHSTFNQATKTSPQKKNAKQPLIIFFKQQLLQKTKQPALNMFHGPEPRTRCLWHTFGNLTPGPHNCPRLRKGLRLQNLRRGFVGRWPFFGGRKATQKMTGQTRRLGGFDDFFAPNPPPPKKNTRKMVYKKTPKFHTLLFFGARGQKHQGGWLFLFLKYTCISVYTSPLKKSAQCPQIHSFWWDFRGVPGFETLPCPIFWGWGDTSQFCHCCWMNMDNTDWCLYIGRERDQTDRRQKNVPNLEFLILGFHVSFGRCKSWTSWRFQPILQIW